MKGRLLVKVCMHVTLDMLTVVYYACFCSCVYRNNTFICGICYTIMLYRIIVTNYSMPSMNRIPLEILSTFCLYLLPVLAQSVVDNRLVMCSLPTCVQHTIGSAVPVVGLNVAL